MKAWEIYAAEVFGDHPCVLISNQRRIELKPHVVVLRCSPLRPDRLYEPGELDAILDESDGLDTRTRCQCDLLFTVQKEKLGRRRGVVCAERRRDIARRGIRGLAIAGL
jgi:hypothetical protein